jgi:hypothetical protein
MKTVSTAKQLQQMITDYVLASITDYDGNSFSDRDEAIRFMTETFHAEYGYNLRRTSPAGACKDYLQGLPSVCTIHFSNYDIYQFLQDRGVVTAYEVDQDEGQIIDLYWNMAGYGLAKLINLI